MQSRMLLGAITTPSWRCCSTDGDVVARRDDGTTDGEEPRDRGCIRNSRFGGFFVFFFFSPAASPAAWQRRAPRPIGGGGPARWEGGGAGTGRRPRRSRAPLSSPPPPTRESGACALEPRARRRRPLRPPASPLPLGSPAPCVRQLQLSLCGAPTNQSSAPRPSCNTSTCSTRETRSI